ncbi:thyroid transcription factor 1-associated protein 26 homolog [Melanotaenia boesemani]|uniref:thyroid transcription factor 1-associated protein 26 homolog n=1 Tax=Melanotaenia boesemani TaxID=1250792 RepID=UPI001C03F2B5|nr:thyroid transcription factor 1-associated protein 26 homolog [Melanotaenia boesemani]
MPPTDNKRKNKNFKLKDGSLRKTKNMAANVKKKRKWIPEHKLFQGSVKEGQGFAFQRKQKVQHEYNKLMRKERKRNPESKVLYKDEYPEHLKHLYMAEAETLSKKAWENRVNRSKLRMKKQGKEMDEDEAVADEDVTGESELVDSASGNPEPSTTSEKESLPVSNRMKKKMQKKTSYQKTKEEFESIREKRKKKKEEYLKNQQQREEAIQRYKQKKMETFQMLSKKTKKGQPNLNLQMEYLLQKIQGTNK